MKFKDDASCDNLEAATRIRDAAVDAWAWYEGFNPDMPMHSESFAMVCHPAHVGFWKRQFAELDNIERRAKQDKN